MSTPTLVDRYVHAATRSVPEPARADLASELRVSIQDQIDARTDGGEDEQESTIAVLEDLGDPDLLAARYTDRPLHLIGPRFFLPWWRLVTLLLWIIVPLAAVGITLGQLLSEASLGDTIGSAVSGTLTAAVHIVFWTTLSFAVLERTTASQQPLTPWTVKDLPELAESEARRTDAIATIVFLVIAAIVLVWDQVHGLVRLADTWVPFVHPTLWPGWLIGLLVVMGVEIVVRVRVYAERRWTMRLATINAAINAVVAVPAMWLLSQDRLLNTAPWVAMIDGDGATVARVVTVVTGVFIVGVAVWDAIDAFLKARRSR